MDFNFYQISILLLQGTFVSLLILTLFRFRKQLGIGMLFAALGLFQFMQVFLSSTVYVEVAKDILVSPGSSVLFTGGLFAILLIYIKEDASETRKLIYALLATNIVMSILLQTFSWNVEESSFFNPLNVTTTLFDNNAWVLFIGTASLFIDSLLIIVIFEFLSKRSIPLFLRICSTMLLVVSFDTVAFSLGAFWGFENLKTIIFSGLISKGVAAVFYSFIFTIYLSFIEREGISKMEFNFKDIFHTLTYRQKFEIVKKEKELIQQKSEQSIQLSESKYFTLVNISPVGVFLTRADGYTTFVNPRWCSISGLSADQALGNGWLEAVHQEDKEKLFESWDKAVKNGVESYAEYRFIRKDGMLTWVLGRAVPEFNAENQIIGYVGTITDITEIKLYEERLNYLKEKAEESDRLKSAFLANMSHEIRTPMNGILGFSELLKNQKLSGEEIKDYIDNIKESGHRMLNIINDIIEISRIESGQVKVNISEVNISEIANSLFSLFETEIASKGISLVIKNKPCETPLIIQTDKEKLSSILTYLTRNAVKFTLQGSIEIGCVKNEHFIEFYVKDTGIGVPKEKKQKIFERFVQADYEGNRAFQGAGLGLSISKAFVEMLGGKIWLESEEGKGSTFFFTIPIKEDKFKSVGEIINIEPVPAENLKKLKILIAEDDKISDHLISTIVKPYCSEILHAKDGHETVETCKNIPDIDVVLMDINLPLIDGYQAANLIRNFRHDIILIAQTAFALDSEIELYGDIFDDYLTKPLDPEVLIKSISKHVSKKPN